ncbi:hypothetical protein D1872_306660 [compost metagenome]
MLARLRHHAVITGHHQQRVVDSANACQHIREKLFMSWHIDKAQYPAIGLRPVGISQIDGHAAFFLFGQAIGIHTRDGLQ